MDGRKQRKFRNYLVDNELQMQVLAYGTLYMLLVVLVTLAIIIFPMARQMDRPGSVDVSYYAAQTFIMVITKIIPAIPSDARSDSMSNVILKNIVKRFKSVTAVDNLSIEIQVRAFAKGGSARIQR